VSFLEIKDAVIIAGGVGSRLRPLTLETPKALIDINGKNLTEHVLDFLSKYDVRNVVLGVSYLADKVMDYFGNGSKHGFNISYTKEVKPMGTAGPLILGPHFKSTFLMINGDNLFDVDLERMYKLHKDNLAQATIALTYVDDPSRYGVVRMDHDKIVEFVEKPKREEAPSHLISSGYYMLEPSVRGLVVGKDFAMMERHVFPKLTECGALYGYIGRGQWFDTGNFESLDLVRQYWKGV
jgi:NDP-sugar pyrophosphorylase family protein